MSQEQVTVPSQVQMDMLKNSIKTLSLIDVNNEDAVAAFEHVAKQSKQDHKSWMFSALDMRVGAPAVAIHFFQLLFAWLQDDHNAIVLITYLPDTLEEIFPDPAKFEDNLVIKLARALEPIASLQLNPSHGSSLIDESSLAFRRLSTFLSENERHEEAFNMSVVSCNLLELIASPQLMPNLEEAMDLAILLQNQDMIGLTSARLAVHIAKAVDQQKEKPLMAFDAIERALLNLPSDLAIRKQALLWLSKYVHAEPYIGLFPLYVLALPEEQRPELPEDALQASIWLNRVSEIEQGAWFEAIVETSSVAIHLEDSRFALRPSNQDQYVQADWAKWSFNYAPFRSAVPFRNSLYREQNLNQILLDLSHEITHIFSMLGQIGLAIVALRIAALEVEMKLWTFTSETGDINPDDLIRFGVAHLNETMWRALPQAEQALEISRKIQILQETWEPWFEGIAIYTQLAADPTLDPDIVSSLMNVFHNLFDNYPEDNLSKEEVIDWVYKQMTTIDQLYSGAIKAESYYFLRRFLIKFHQHYLAGYLVVRKLVSTWRSILDRPLSGYQAARILLYFTRYGSLETVPNLSLSLDDFKTKTRQYMTTWLENISKVSRNDLETILDVHQKFSVWQDGRVILRDRVDISPANPEGIADLVRQAHASLRGEHANLHRISNADEECIAYLQASAEGLAESQTILAKESIIDLYIKPLYVLPIGQVEVPFWLSRSRSAVFCLVRTTEITNDLKKPGYNGYVFPLMPEEFAQLESLIAFTRITRMKITRVADATLNDQIDGRGRGRNYFVLQYGDWIQIQSRGLYFKSSEIPASFEEAVHLRFAQNPYHFLDTNVIADGSAGANRTRKFAKDLLEERESHPIKPWIEYVIELSEQVLEESKRPERSQISLMLFEWFFDNLPLARSLFQQGLSAVYEDNNEKLKELIRLLDQSARLPVTNLEPQFGELYSGILKKTKFGWDVTPR